MATGPPRAGRAGGGSKDRSTSRGWASSRKRDYTVLMGANTYRLMSGFAAEGEPGTDVLAGMSKVVFSTTLSEPLAWANTRLVAAGRRRGRAGDEGRGRRQSMRTMGSLTLCRSLLKAGLVDRFRVVVFPVITGSTAGTGSTTATPTSLSTWSAAAPSTVASSCSSTSPVLDGPPGADTASA